MVNVIYVQHGVQMLALIVVQNMVHKECGTHKGRDRSVHNNNARANNSVCAEEKSFYVGIGKEFVEIWRS